MTGADDAVGGRAPMEPPVIDLMAELKKVLGLPPGPAEGEEADPFRSTALAASRATQGATKES
jgi:hypothetical protein